MIEKFTGDTVRETRRSVFRSSVDNFSAAARTHSLRQPTLPPDPPPLTFSTSMSLFSLSLSHSFSLRSPISATIVFYFQPPSSDNSVRKFSFGSQPVSHLKQPTNTPTYDFTLYFPPFLFYHPTATPFAISFLSLSLSYPFSRLSFHP